MPLPRIDRSSFREEFDRAPVPWIDQDEEVLLQAHERVEERARWRQTHEADVDGFSLPKSVKKNSPCPCRRTVRSRRKAG